VPATPAHSQAEIEAARYAELNAVPSSELAVTLCDRMARKLFHQRKCGPTRLQREAFGTIVADLLGRDQPMRAVGSIAASVQGASQATKLDTGFSVPSSTEWTVR